jgi:hypothetical protein
LLLTTDEADYALGDSEVVILPAGDIPSSGCTSVAAIADSLLEGDQSFSIGITDIYEPLGLVSIGTPNTTRIKITEEDGK